MYSCITANANQMSQKQPIKMSDALKRMRDLSERDIPFSLGFYKCNTTNGSSEGYKVVSQAILRKGYRSDQSNKADILIGYIDYDQKEKERWFYLPLLMMFNGNKVTP